MESIYAAQIDVADCCNERQEFAAIAPYYMVHRRFAHVQNRGVHSSQLGRVTSRDLATSTCDMLHVLLYCTV